MNISDEFKKAIFKKAILKRFAYVKSKVRFKRSFVHKEVAKAIGIDNIHLHDIHLVNDALYEMGVKKICAQGYWWLINIKVLDTTDIASNGAVINNGAL